MALVGLDFGSLHSLMTTPIKGAIQVVRNELADRLTPSMVGYTEKERLVGDAALSQVKSNFKNTCVNLKNILGRKLEYDESTKENSLHHEEFFALAELAETEDKQLGYRIKYKGKDVTFAASQVTAAFLQKLRSVVEKNTGRAVNEIVSSCPPWYSYANRAALADAFAVAGINCTAIVGEELATSLEYGWFRAEEIKKAEASRRVAFISIGHSTSWIAVVEYSCERKLEILSCVSIADLGGRDIDNIIVQHFAKIFEKDTKLKPLENPKAKQKLLDQAMKTKVILSANSETNFHIECLIDEYDCTGVIKRTDLEDMLKADFIPKFVHMLNKGMSNSGLESNQLFAIEMIGGCSRIPSLQAAASEYFKKSISKTVNADECVARGCSLVGAMCSPNFRSVAFSVVDRTCFPIEAYLDNALPSDYVEDDKGSRRNTNNTAKNNQCIGVMCGNDKILNIYDQSMCKSTKRRIMISRESPFSITLRYSLPSLLPPGSKAVLGVLRVEQIERTNPEENNKLLNFSIHISQDSFGRVSIVNVFCLKMVEVDEIVTEKMSKQNNLNNENGQQNQTNIDNNADIKTEENDLNTNTQEFEEVQVKRRVKKEKYVSIPHSFSPQEGCRMMATTIENWKHEETKMIADDLLQAQTLALMNECESYVYDMRDKLSSTLSAYVDENNKASFLKVLNETEGWLYDQCDSSKNVFLDKLNYLREIGNPIVFRCKEKENRETEAHKILNNIKRWREIAENRHTDFCFAPFEKIQQFIEELNASEVWVNEKSKIQNSLPSYEDATEITSKMIGDKHMQLHQMAIDLNKESNAARVPETSETESSNQGQKPPQYQPESPVNADQSTNDETNEETSSTMPVD